MTTILSVWLDIRCDKCDYELSVKIETEHITCPVCGFKNNIERMKLVHKETKNDC